MANFKVASSRVEDGQEICNTCGRPANAPYRYQTPNGQRGCIASCHDVHVRFSKDADWVSKKRYRLPKWISAARTALGERFERFRYLDSGEIDDSGDCGCPTYERCLKNHSAAI